MENGSNINDAFFNGFYKDVWRTLIPAGLSEAETDFIEEVAQLQKGQKVLDLMCGYGRHSLLLAQREYTVTAVDNSSDYIEEIKTKAAAQNLPVKTICKSLTALEIDAVYDAAICMGNSFAFFNSREATAILHNLSAHLKKGGVFIINTWMLGEIALKHFRDKEWFYSGDYKYLIDNRYVFNPSRIESEHIIIRSDGATETIKGIDYIFTVSEMGALFNGAGFSLTAVYSTPRKKPFQLGDARAYLVAIKL